MKERVLIFAAIIAHLALLLGTAWLVFFFAPVWLLDRIAVGVLLVFFWLIAGSIQRDRELSRKLKAAINAEERT